MIPAGRQEKDDQLEMRVDARCSVHERTLLVRTE